MIKVDRLNKLLLSLEAYKGKEKGSKRLLTAYLNVLKELQTERLDSKLGTELDRMISNLGDKGVRDIGMLLNTMESEADLERLLEDVQSNITNGVNLFKSVEDYHKDLLEMSWNICKELKEDKFVRSRMAILCLGVIRSADMLKLDKREAERLIQWFFGTSVDLRDLSVPTHGIYRSMKEVENIPSSSNAERLSKIEWRYKAGRYESVERLIDNRKEDELYSSLLNEMEWDAEDQESWSFIRIGEEKYVTDGIKTLFLSGNRKDLYFPIWRRFIPKMTIRFRRKTPTRDSRKVLDAIITFQENWFLNIVTILAVIPAIIEMYPHYYNKWVEYISIPYRLYMKYNHTVDYVLEDTHAYLDMSLLMCKLSYGCIIGIVFYILYIYKLKKISFMEYVLKKESIFLVYVVYIWSEYEGRIVRRRTMNTRGPWRDYLNKILYNVNPYIPENSYLNYKEYRSMRYGLFMERFINTKLKVPESGDNGWQHRFKYNRPGIDTNMFTLDWLNSRGQHALGSRVRGKIDYKSVCNRVLKFVNLPYRFEGTEVEIGLREKYRWRLKQRYFYSQLRGHLNERMGSFKERVERQYMFYPDYYYLGGYVGNSIRCLDDLEGYDKIFSSYYRQSIAMLRDKIIQEPVRLNELRDWYDAHLNSTPYCPWNGNLRRVWRKEIPVQKFDGKRNARYDYWYKENIVYPNIEEVNLYERQHINLVGKRLRYKQWETEDPNNYIGSGSKILRVSAEEDVERKVKRLLEEPNIIVKHLYVLYRKFLSKLLKDEWSSEKVVDEEDDKYIKMDIRRNKKLYRWRNEIEYGSNSYGSHVRTRDIYDKWGRALPPKAMGRNSFRTTLYPTRLDVVQMRERLLVEERETKTSVLGILEDADILRGMGMFDENNYKDFVRWLKYEYLQDTLRERTLLRKKLRSNLRKRNRIAEELHLEAYDISMGCQVGVSDNQRERELSLVTWKMNLDRFDIFDLHESHVLFKKMANLSGRLSKKGLGRRYKKYRHKDKGKNRTSNENKFFNYYIDDKLVDTYLEYYLEDVEKKDVFSGNLGKLPEYWRYSLANWRHRKNKRGLFAKAMERNGMWPCKETSILFEKLEAQERYILAKQRLMEERRFRGIRPNSKRSKIKLLEPLIPWGRKTMTSLMEDELLSQILARRKVVEHRQRLAFDLLKSLKEGEILEARLNRVSKVEERKLKRLTTYIQSLYDEYDVLNKNCRNFSMGDTIRELSMFLYGTPSNLKRRGIFPNEGPGMGYYYKDFIFQFKRGELDIYGDIRNLRLTFPGEYDYRKRTLLPKHFRGYGIEETRAARTMINKRKDAVKLLEKNTQNVYRGDERWGDSGEQKIIRPLSDVRNSSVLNESDLYIEAADDWDGIVPSEELSRFWENSEANHSMIRAPIGRRTNLKWTDSAYPWSANNMMGGNYSYNGGPIVVGSEGYAWNYNGRSLVKGCVMRAGSKTKWSSEEAEIEEEAESELPILRVKRNYEEDWRGIGKDVTNYEDCLLQSVNYAYDRMKYETAFLRRAIRSYHINKKKVVRDAHLNRILLKKTKHLFHGMLPDEREPYRHNWLQEREGTAFRKASLKKYDYYYYNNPVPQEYYTVGREYWMPSKLYLEDVITDVDKIDREIIAYEIHRYLLLRYEYPLEVLIVNALTGFDMGILTFMIF